MKLKIALCGLALILLGSCSHKNSSDPVELTDNVVPNSPSSPDTPPPPPSGDVPHLNKVKLIAQWLHMMGEQFDAVVLPKSYDTIINNYWQNLLSNNFAYQNYDKANDIDRGTASKVCTSPMPNAPSNQATIERALMQQGLDVYDGSVWQIALSLSSLNSKIYKSDQAQYVQDVQRYQRFLNKGFSDGFSGFQSYRAWQNPDRVKYTYNQSTMPDAEHSYLLKFISPSYADNWDPINNCALTWPEYDAITGEEAWAVLIGPVQTVYNLQKGASGWANDDNYLQVSKDALDAFLAMQNSQTGGVYRSVTQPLAAADKTISIENNFSLYAGLNLLKEALNARTLKSNEDLLALAKIQILQNGLLKFFTNSAGLLQVFDKDGYFYSSINSNYSTVSPGINNFAVDVQTWGSAVIASSPELSTAIAAAYGKNALFNMFENAINLGGYWSQDGTKLLGVGYTKQAKIDDDYVLSGEWTFGAINAAIVLADYYKDDETKQTILIQQAQQMLAGATQEVASAPDLASKPFPSTLSYLYANKRVYIPFGWFSNAVPSTASTGWALFVNSCYNPFELGGGHYSGICQKLGIELPRF